MRILVVNFGTKSNLGCSALLRGMLQLIERAYPGSETKILSFHRYGNAPDADILVSPFAPGDGYRGSIVALSIEVLIVALGFPFLRNRHTRRWFRRRFPEESTLIDEYNSSDIVVSTGGDLLTEEYGYYSLFVTTVHLFFGILAKKKVVLFGESIGPFHNPVVKRLIRLLLRRSRFVLTRESLSERYVRSQGIAPERVFRMPDPSLALEPMTKTSMPQTVDRIHARSPESVCVFPSALAWSFVAHARDNPKMARARYIDSLVGIVRYFLSETEATVTLVPHVTGPRHSDDDTVICRELAARFEESHRVCVLPAFNEPEEVRSLLSGFSFVIALRMHAAIAGYANGVPTFCIGYSQKFKGMVLDYSSSDAYFFDLKDKELNLDEIEDIVRRVRACWDNRREEAEFLNHVLRKDKDRFDEVVRILRLIAGPGIQ